MRRGVRGQRLDSSGSGWIPVVSSYEHECEVSIHFQKPVNFLTS
jgi:hypothetical protein